MSVFRHYGFLRVCICLIQYLCVCVCVCVRACVRACARARVCVFKVTFSISSLYESIIYFTALSAGCMLIHV